MELKKKTSFPISIVLAIISGFVTIYVLFNTPDVYGTGLYFTLPLTYSICCILFSNIFQYSRGGFALKLFFFMCTLRYVFLPFFTCQVGHFAQQQYSPQAYIYAILIQNIELLTSFRVIYFFYPKEHQRLSYKITNNQSTYYDDLSVGGVMVLVFASALMMSRGVSSLLASSRFFVISEQLDKESMYGYDIWMANTLKAYIVIIVTSHFQKRNDKKSSIINLIIPLAIALISCIWVFGNNRMSVVYYALAAISIIFYAFPKYKGISTAIILPALIIVLVSFTLMKQFSVNIEEGESVQLEESGVAASLSVYVSSTEAIAKTYDLYEHTGNRMKGVLTLWADFVDKTNILHLPFLAKIFVTPIKDVSPSYRLAMTGHEICPTAGQTLYYGGYWFGWLIDIFVFIIVIRLLIICEIHSKYEANLGNRYLYTWVASVLAMVMSYHIGIIWNIISYVPFFTWMALLINRTIRFKRKSIFYVQQKR